MTNDAYATPGPGSLLEMRHIEKSFSGTRVLDDVDLDVRAGEVHVIAGENGAGKSTLMNILCGVHPEYGGDVFLNGRKAVFQSPADSAAAGIAMIHQEMSLIPSLNAVDNIFLGRELTRHGVWIDRSRQRDAAAGLLDRLGLDIDPDTPIGNYRVSVHQVIEIAKALALTAG